MSVWKKGLGGAGLCAVLAAFSFEASAQPAVLKTVGGLLERAEKSQGNTQHFFHDLYDSVEFFMKRPERLSVYSTSRGRFVEGAAPANVASSQLCTQMKVGKRIRALPIDASIVKAYNAAKQGSSERRNFWVATAACLSGHEGSEAWLINDPSRMKFNKIDVKVDNPKFVYGVFQLSTERGTALQAACEKSWHDFKTLASPSGAPKDYLAGHATLVNLSDATVSGKTSTAGSLRSLGDMRRQRFNVYSGVHEIFRAAASGSAKCLNPFDRTQNRFGPLPTRSQPLLKCINTMAPRAMKAGDNVDRLVAIMRHGPDAEAPKGEAPKAILVREHASTDK